MIYRTDYHTHTGYSDGKGSPADFIPFAIKEGLSEIGFSDHLTLTPVQQEWSITPGLIDNYVKEVTDLKKGLNSISVKLGLEVDYFPGKESEIKAVTDNYPFDYIIGSVHYMGEESVDANPDFYSGKNIRSLYSDYFDLVGSASASGLFDIMGHIDLVRIFGICPEDDISPLYRKLARILKLSDVTIEINTNGKNKQVNDYYPDPAYLTIFREEEVPLCINSDAHLPSRVGQHFDEAYALILRAGYNSMATFDRRKRIIKEIR